MCLSTVYKDRMAPESILMKNVMRIDCKDGCIILTDLMERSVAIEGSLLTANLVDGYVIVEERVPA
ncbi:MAG: CooT family nickel-binding protein [Firmicutes bacterium]|nr:CooT family nickel-binding protein [Bacillota bacterium]